MTLQAFHALCRRHDLTVRPNDTGDLYRAYFPDGKRALHHVYFTRDDELGQQGYFSIRPKVVRPRAELTERRTDYDLWHFGNHTYLLTGPGHVRLVDVIKAGTFADVLAVLRP